MSFCGVVTTRSRATPCASATAKYMAVMGAAMPLIVSETLTRLSGMPANASSMSARVSMAMPTRPTSPSGRGSSESSPSCVGRSKATFSASWPCAIRYLKRALVSAGVPKPMYWRIVHRRSRYMCAWIPRVNGYSPGRPTSRSTSRPVRSSGPYTGLIGNPACVLRSFIASSLRRAMPASREVALEGLHDLRQRRAHREHAAYAERSERVEIARRDDPADDDADVVRALRAQAVEHASRERHVGTGENREPDHVHVLLHRLRDDLLGRALEPRVDHLEAGVAQRLHDDLGAAVVPVEAGLCDQDFHARSTVKAGRYLALPFGSSVTRRGASRTRWPTFTVAGSATVRRVNTRCPSTFTIANTRGPSKPAGSPVSCTVNAWIVPSRARSTHSNASDAHSPQKPRGGHAVVRHDAQRVVTSRPSPSRA